MKTFQPSSVLTRRNPGLLGSNGDGIVAAAKQQEGVVPYVFGGGDVTGPTATSSSAGVRGFDCSGLSLYSVYKGTNGKVQLPHFAGSQFPLGQPVGSGSTNLLLLITSGKLQPGDLLFFNIPESSGASQLTHVGIYTGAGQMLNAPRPGFNVESENLLLPYWQGVFAGARRYVPSDSGVVKTGKVLLVLSLVGAAATLVALAVYERRKLA